jgi:hypothetical protein
VLRVTVIAPLSHMVVVRERDWTLVCIPPTMTYQDGHLWSQVLYSNEEAATFRAYFGVPARNGADGWSDVLPPTLCPCLVPEPLRLQPWPPCLLHDGATADVDVVEVAERMLRP